MAACEEIIDLLVLRIGGGKGSLESGVPEYDKRFSWPRPAKDVARTFWRNAREMYDGVHQPLLVEADPISVRWYVLGRVSVEYDGGRDLVVGGGKEISFVDPEPCLVVYGEPNVNLIAAVAEIVGPACARLGLGLWLASPGPMVGDMRIKGHVALISFPHDRYGDGEGLIRVRCVQKHKETP